MTLLEFSLSFTEGVALIASPCILPVLPLVLSTSIDGGRARPFGIITGFILSFCLLALLSRRLVLATGIAPDSIKDISLLLLFLFGLILLSDKLSAWFSRLTQRFADIGTRLSPGNGKEGLASGIVLGALIGLVWTPCAGPILAAVLVQIIRQETDLESVALMVAFAMGAGFPMFIIAITGRRIMNKFAFLQRYTEQIRKILGGVIITSVIFIAAGSNAQLPFFNSNPVSQPAARLDHIEDALPQPYPAPDFAGITQWLNSPALTMKQLRGKVVLVDFWTYSCINCIRTLPHITAWDAQYRDKGLVIIGIHSPEFEFEKNPENVKQAVARYSIHYPVALDNQLDTWQNFRNLYWPAHYLINQEGMVVYTHFGEGNYDVTENNIRYLLGEKDMQTASPTEIPYALGQTPETYLGYRRSDSYLGPTTIQPDIDTSYRFPKFLPSDSWSLQGGWKVEAEKITSTAPGAALQLNFKARNVFLVLGSASGKPVNASITLNGETVGKNAGKDIKNGTLVIDSHRLYDLIHQQTVTNSLLEITSDSPGLEAYAFTFGN